MQDDQIENKEPQRIIHEHDVGSNLGCFLIIIAICLLIYTCNKYPL